MVVEKLINIVRPELEQVNDIIIKAAANQNVELVPVVTNHLVSAGGKRVRPVLTLASSQLCEYSGGRQINLAAAVEFMHTATLLHDDVVDESEKRRGKLTANNIWGNKASVLVGDYLLGRAFQMMTADGSIEVLEILSDAAAKISEGELMQLETTGNIETTREQYIAVIKAKTAELFAAACEVSGAIIEDEKKRKALQSFGENFGIAFQIVDDALDYIADESELGKNLGDDIREGKVTLPLIVAYERAEPAEREFLGKVVKTPEDIDDEKQRQVGEIIEKYDGAKQAVEEAKVFAKTAQDALNIFPDSEVKEVMQELAVYSLSRVS